MNGLHEVGPCPRCGKEWRDCPCGKVDIVTGEPIHVSMGSIRYEPETATFRTVPENYCLAFRGVDGRWSFFGDGSTLHARESISEVLESLNIAERRTIDAYVEAIGRVWVGAQIHRVFNANEKRLRRAQDELRDVLHEAETEGP